MFCSVGSKTLIQSPIRNRVKANLIISSQYYVVWFAAAVKQEQGDNICADVIHHTMQLLS